MLAVGGHMPCSSWVQYHTATLCSLLFSALLRFLPTALPHLACHAPLLPFRLLLPLWACHLLHSCCTTLHLPTYHLVVPVVCPHSCTPCCSSHELLPHLLLPTMPIRTAPTTYTRRRRTHAPHAGTNRARGALPHTRTAHTPTRFTTRAATRPTRDLHARTPR